MEKSGQKNFRSTRVSLTFRRGQVTLFAVQQLGLSMSKVIENKFLRLELGDDGTLLSLRSLVSGTEFASPHGLWRLICNCGDDQEVELSAERASVRIATLPRKFKMEYRDLTSPQGKKLDVIVTDARSAESSTS